ncbi:MAG: adenylate/guanylate cyclase domain-containing protein [Verrucomicrobiota bacterium]
MPLGSACVIGRGPDADVRVQNRQVSREHAMIRHQNSGYWLYDLDSSNGTSHNDRLIDTPVPLQHGDRIGIADVSFSFFDQDQGESGSTQGMEDPPTVIGVRKTPIIALVTDVIGFSRLAEKLTEEQLAKVLNAWYGDCRALMNESGGEIEKFMGDGMLAYWKETSPSSRTKAVKAARVLCEGLREPSEEVDSLLRVAGVELKCGVGLHVGEAALGAVTRGMQTALGEAVNMAFRIEAQTREIGYRVLASQQFFEGWEAGKMGFECMGEQHLKGSSHSVELFALQEFPLDS